jgi:hypothetical protein
MQPRLNNKIFFQIAAWRDPFVMQTIQHAIKNAYSPKDLVFGVVFQGYEEDNWMIEGIHDLGAEVRLIKIDANDAPLSLCKIRGPIGCSVMQDESFYIQVDSHTKMNYHWDISLMAELELASLLFGKSIITAQSSNFHKWDDDFIENNQISIPDAETFAMIGAPVVGKLEVKTDTVQVKEKFFNANCVFAYSDFVREVPQPSEILFQYEQPMMALRTFTGGYWMVSPTRSYSSVFDYHNVDDEHERDEYIKYIRFEDPLWKDKWGNKEQENKQLYEKILREEIIDKDNGLLDKRTLSEFIDFAGYNPLTLEVTKDYDLYADGNFAYVSGEVLESAKESIKLFYN